MQGRNKKRDSKIRSLFDNEIFVKQLDKVRDLPEDEWDIHVINIRNKWRLAWDYHETLYKYIETSVIDYGLGDPDIRVVDFKAQTMEPSLNPSDEFRIMKSIEPLREKGVYIKIPKDISLIQLKDFVSDKETYSLIEKALDNNYPDRNKHQAPEHYPKRKVGIYRMHENGEPIDLICKTFRCDPRYVYAVVKEFNDKILY